MQVLPEPGTGTPRAVKPGVLPKSQAVQAVQALLLLTLVLWYLLGFPDRGSVGRAVRG